RRDAAALAVAALPGMTGGEQPLELEIGARRWLSPVRPSSVTTLISCHCPPLCFIRRLRKRPRRRATADTARAAVAGGRRERGDGRSRPPGRASFRAASSPATRAR